MTTTYQPRPTTDGTGRRIFTTRDGSRVITRTLDDLMGLDALPVRVTESGDVETDLQDVRAPEELYGDDDTIRATVKAAGWELLEGYTGQYGYNGPVLHASEYIGGGLETAILETPGIYAVEVVYVEDEDDENGESEPAGWVVMRKLDDAQPEPVAPLAPGDRVEVGGRERVVTSVVPSRHRGRRALYVAHTAPGDDPWFADVTTVPVPLESDRESYSPRVLAAHVLTSAAHTLRVAGVIVPETPASARQAYVAARERGEGVALALTRARLEMAADGDATCGQCGDDRTAVQGEHHGRTVWLCERHAVTCGTCGHIYSDTTPAGRCPREADHEDEDDGLDDVDRELVSQHKEMTDKLERLHALAITALGRGTDVSPADVLAITEL